VADNRMLFRAGALCAGAPAVTTLPLWRAWQTIRGGPGSPTSTLRSSIKTPCLVSFRNGWPVTMSELMRGLTASIVKSLMPSRDQRWSIVRLARMRPDNTFPIAEMR
jgi:hypothetical protein